MKALGKCLVLYDTSYGAKRILKGVSDVNQCGATNNRWIRDFNRIASRLLTLWCAHPDVVTDILTENNILREMQVKPFLPFLH